MPASDEQELELLVARADSGDEAALAELFNFAFGRLETLARKMLRQFPGVRRWEQTDDVWQNASLRLWNSLGHVKLESPRHFLRLAALNIRRELLDLARRYGGPEGLQSNLVSPVLGEQESSRPGPLEPAAHSSDAARLARWTEFHLRVSELPEPQREVFDLVWYQGLTQADVAGLLRLSLRTVKRRWLEARLALHDSLELADLTSDA